MPGILIDARCAAVNKSDVISPHPHPETLCCMIGRDLRKDSDVSVEPWRINWRWPVDREWGRGVSAQHVPYQSLLTTLGKGEVQGSGYRWGWREGQSHVVGRLERLGFVEDHWEVDEGLYAGRWWEWFAHLNILSLDWKRPRLKPYNWATGGCSALEMWPMWLRS